MLFHGQCDDVFGGSLPRGQDWDRRCPENRLICDDRLVGLVTIPRLQILGVRPGGNCMANLVTQRGFVFDDGSGAGQYIEPAPGLNLPIINPLASWAYPVPAAGFQFLLIGTSDNPSLWKFVAAPTGGSYFLSSQNGQMNFVNASVQPVVQSVCGSVSSSALVAVVGCVPTGTFDTNGNPIYGLNKLTLRDNRPVVGRLDTDGITKLTTPSDTTPFYHPIIQADKIILTGNNSGGLNIVILPTFTTTGMGSVTDASPIYYSPTTGLIYSSAGTGSQIIALNQVLSTDQSAPTVATWTVINAFNFGTQTVNYPNLSVGWNLCFNGSPVFLIAVFIDGIQNLTWSLSRPSQPSPRCAGTGIITGIALGNHTIDFRINVTSTSVALNDGNAMIHTVR
jgi:hypothetical protein